MAMRWELEREKLLTLWNYNLLTQSFQYQVQAISWRELTKHIFIMQYSDVTRKL
jgi:hypothetical protein